MVIMNNTQILLIITTIISILTIVQGVVKNEKNHGENLNNDKIYHEDSLGLESKMYLKRGLLPSDEQQNHNDQSQNAYQTHNNMQYATHFAPSFSQFYAATSPQFYYVKAPMVMQHGHNGNYGFLTNGQTNGGLQFAQSAIKLAYAAQPQFTYIGSPSSPSTNTKVNYTPQFLTAYQHQPSISSAALFAASPYQQQPQQHHFGIYQQQQQQQQQPQQSQHQQQDGNAYQIVLQHENVQNTGGSDVATTSQSHAIPLETTHVQHLPVASTQLSPISTYGYATAAPSTVSPTKVGSTAAPAFYGHSHSNELFQPAALAYSYKPSSAALHQVPPPQKLISYQTHSSSPQQYKHQLISSPIQSGSYSNDGASSETPTSYASFSQHLHQHGASATAQPIYQQQKYYEAQSTQPMHYNHKIAYQPIIGQSASASTYNTIGFSSSGGHNNHNNNIHHQQFSNNQPSNGDAIQYETSHLYQPSSSSLSPKYHQHQHNNNHHNYGKTHKLVYSN